MTSTASRYQRRGEAPCVVPRFSSPLSFLARVPYSLALLSTAVGLLLAFNLAASAAPVRGGRSGSSSLGYGGLAAPGDPNIALNFTQVVDHFNSLDGRTFRQRYWQDQRWWKVPPQAENHPLAILHINSFHSTNWTFSTISSWAQELGAIVYELEPRYAGRSYPVPDVDTFDLRFYSIEQNVADVVAFISVQGASLPNNTRWIVMGELFDGAFATWVRAKPRVAFGVVAVSPHLLAVESYPAYDLAYQAAIGSKCSKVIHDLLATVSWTLKNATTNAAFQAKCQSDPQLPDAEFMYVVSTILFSNMDYDYTTMCRTFDRVKDKDNATRLNTLASFIVDYNKGFGMRFEDWDFARDTNGNLTAPGAGFRPTYYLKCTQLGQFETSSGPHSLIPAERNREWYLSVCNKLFNLSSDAGPQVDRVNTNFGGRMPEGCNMAFVVSPNDPYALLGPDPVAIAASGKTSGNQIIEVGCESAQVTLDLFQAASSYDVPCIVNARAQVLTTLKAWQTQPDSCPTAPAPPGGNNGGGGHGDGAMALVGVFSAVGGIILGVGVAVVVFVYLSRRIIQRWKSSAYTHVL